jgi:hypothetical protein
LQERELRAFGQELHPALVRLGLPAALRSLKKDLAERVDLTLDIDAAADSVSDGPERSRIAPALRLVLYRAIQDATTAMSLAGASEASITIRRDGDQLDVLVAATAGATVDAGALDATALALQAYGATLAVAARESRTEISWSVAAPPAEGEPDASFEQPGEGDDARPPSEPATAEASSDDEAPSQNVPAEEERAQVVSTPDWRATLPLDGPTTSAADGHVPAGASVRPGHVTVIPAESIDMTPLSARLRAIAEATPILDMTINVDASADRRTLSGDPVLPPAIANELAEIARIAAATLVDVNATACAIAAEVSEESIYFSITATVGAPVSMAAFAAIRDAIEARDGFFGVSHRDGTVTITAEAPVGEADEPAVVRVAVIPAARDGEPAEDDQEDSAGDDPEPLNIAALLEPDEDAPAA